MKRIFFNRTQLLISNYSRHLHQSKQPQKTHQVGTKYHAGKGQELYSKAHRKKAANEMENDEPNIEIDFEALGSGEGRNGQKPFPREPILDLTIT